MKIWKEELENKSNLLIDCVVNFVLDYVHYVHGVQSN